MPRAGSAALFDLCEILGGLCGEAFDRKVHQEKPRELREERNNNRISPRASAAVLGDLYDLGLLLLESLSLLKRRRRGDELHITTPMKLTPDCATSAIFLASP